jgi:hydrogenase maturation protease
MKSVSIIGIGDVLHGDEAFACYVLEALSWEPWKAPVQLAYVGQDPRRAMGIIGAADVAIIVGALNLNGSAGRLYHWTYSVFQRNISWVVDEHQQIGLLAEALAKVEMAGELPEELVFLWVQPHVIAGYGMSCQLRRAVWQTTRVIKRKLFEIGFLPEASLSVFPIVHIEHVSECIPHIVSKG